MGNSDMSIFDIKDKDFKGLIYLASPYTHKLLEVEELRYNLACRAVKEFMMLGCTVISPIVHCHLIAVKYGLPGDFTFWKRYNAQLLKNCTAMRVLKIPGWFNSIGISNEIVFANRNGIPQEEVDLNGDAYRFIELAWQ